MKAGGDKTGSIADKPPGTLIVLGGLPATGKTTLARLLCVRIGAVHLRIDTIEQTVRTQLASGADVGAIGYAIAQSIARDNLRLGLTVVADSVNPIDETRDSWLAAGVAAGAPVIEVELIRSDPSDHRQQVESRVSDIVGLRLPSWQDVQSRDYRSWTRPHLVVDTSGRTIEESLRDLLLALPELA